jgi:hypothetical protein
MFSATAHAQQGGQEGLTPAKRDTIFKERVVQDRDSLAIPFFDFGAIGSSASDTAMSVSKVDRRLFQYRSFDELLIRATPYMPLSQGGNAQFNSISILGGMQSDVAVSFNGRSMLDPWSSVLHMAQIAPEGMERAEILTGVHAVGLAPSMTLSAVNIQEIRHNSATPYTALWYTQGGGDVIAADAGFSQNVAAGLNFTLGVRRSGAIGRYVNTGYDVWNVRTAVRYAMSDRTNLGVSYQLSSLNTELWGGLRTTLPLSQLTERTAPPVFFTLQDQSRRHDITFTGSHWLTADSLHRITVQMFGTLTNMLRIRDSTLYTSALDTMDHVTFHALHTGVVVRMDDHFGALHLRTGISLDHTSSDSTVYSSELSDVAPQVFAHARITLEEGLNLVGAGRAAIAGGEPLTAFGGGIEWMQGAFDLAADVSTTQRMPSVAESRTLSPERHVLASLTTHVRLPTAHIMGQAFYRVIDGALATTTDRDSLQFIRSTMTSNGTTRSVMGLVTQATISIDDLLSEGLGIELRPVLRLHVEPDVMATSRTLPLVSGELSAAAVYRVRSSTVKLGTRVAMVSPMASRQFVPLTWTNTDPVSSQSWVGNGLDLYLTALLGNASVRFSWENILGEQWYTTAIAPEIISDVRLSVTWSFFD